jgi:mannan endo-1,4-beta-mannosidase
MWVLAAGIAVIGLLVACWATVSVLAGTDLSKAPRPLIGVYEPGAPTSWTPVTNFTTASGVHPKIVVYYSGWYEHFWSSFASEALHSNATVLIQLDPQNVSLNSISAGKSDWYLSSFAKSVKKFRGAVLLSFGHEMNGVWYPWGDGYVSPATFVAAWRHVVQVFRNERVSNVRWVWTVTSRNETAGSLRSWWPGSSWVNFVGVDGYYYTPSDTYNSVFGTMLSKIRVFSRAPVLISEVGIGPNPNRIKQIAALYAGATSDHFSGIIWFDEAQDGGLYSQDWRLEDDPAALAAFEKAVNSCCE